MRKTLFVPGMRAGMRAGMRRSRRGAIVSDPVWAGRAPYRADGRNGSKSRRFMRYVLRRVAVLVALLILFYATSLHGISLRTFILAGLLILALYWLFRDTLRDGPVR